MKIVNWCLYLYVLLKPFYIGKSGILQLSDIFILIAFVTIFFLNFRKSEKNIIEYEIKKKLTFFLIYILCIVIINSIYYCISQVSTFLTSSLYYIFVFLGLYVFSSRVHDEKFLKNIYYCFVIDLILQLIFYFCGIGESLYNGTRYIGTFNDPNQFGFFIIISMAYICIISNILKINFKLNILSYIIGCYLIYLSASTGMFLAVIVFILLNLISLIKLKIRKINKISKVSIFVLFLILLLVLFIFQNNKLNNYILNFFNENIMNSSILDRVNNKIDKFENTDSNFFEDRHLDKFINNYTYIFWGSGEGEFDRFGNNSGEIHSTFPCLLFYYGIIPFLILVYWIFINLKGLSFRQLIPYITIFIESFTLAHQRQLLFWVLIILANVFVICKKNNKLRRNPDEYKKIN